MPLKFTITPGQAHDISVADQLLADVKKGQTVLADKAYTAQWLRDMLKKKGAKINIPPKSNSVIRRRFNRKLYKERNHVERFFNKLKYFRRIATGYEKLGTTFLSMVKLAAIRICLRFNESTA